MEGLSRLTVRWRTGLVKNAWCEVSDVGDASRSDRVGEVVVVASAQEDVDSELTTSHPSADSEVEEESDDEGLPER